jgi:hypothetical protein
MGLFTRLSANNIGGLAAIVNELRAGDRLKWLNVKLSNSSPSQDHGICNFQPATFNREMSPFYATITVLIHC